MNMNIADEASMARPVYICGVLIMSVHKCRLSLRTGEYKAQWEACEGLNVIS